MPEVYQNDVQYYLRSGKTLDDLAQEFAIKANISEELGIVCLNYSQIASPMDNPICQQCRGLILELGTWNLVSRSFDKFFNYGEPNAADIDWTTARVQDKLDGSLISIYHWHGKWRVASRGVADASGNVGNNNLSFCELVLLTVNEMCGSWQSFTNFLNRTVCYSFELTSPDNRIICNYPERVLTYLSSWVVETGEERYAGAPCDMPVPRSFRASTIEGLIDLAKCLDPFDNEGFVVVDSRFRRIKVKSPLYVAASHLIAGLTTTKQHVELVLSGTADDVIPAIPDHLRKEVIAAQSNIREMITRFSSIYEHFSFIKEQKDFAMEVKVLPCSAVMFAMRKGQTAEECLKRMTIDSVMRLYSLYMEVPANV